MAAVRFFSLLCLVFVMSIGNANITSDLLWPQPSQMQFGTDVYGVERDTFTITTDGVGASSTLLMSAVDRYYDVIFKSSVPFYPATDDVTIKGQLAGLKVTVSSSDERLNLTTDESCKIYNSCVFKS